MVNGSEEILLRSFQTPLQVSRALTCLEHLLDSSQGLSGAFFVFDEGEPNVLVAVLAKSDAGAHGNLGID
jgi:hypothetical protein